MSFDLTIVVLSHHVCYHGCVELIIILKNNHTSIWKPCQPFVFGLMRYEANLYGENTTVIWYDIWTLFLWGNYEDWDYGIMGRSEYTVAEP